MDITIQNMDAKMPKTDPGKLLGQKEWERHDALLEKKINNGWKLPQAEQNELEMLIARNLNPERNINPDLVNEAEDLAKKYRQ